MAMDLLSVGKVPLHRHRHDLESFFSVVLAWFCAVFDPERHSFRHLPEWEVADLKVIGRNKASFLLEQEIYEATMLHSHPDYQALASEWVEPLSLLFSQILVQYQIVQGLRKERRQAKRKGNQMMQGRINAEIAKAKARRHYEITYETFMECLDVPAEAF
ncbi:hypothetical protein AcV7_009958 [Taiwanofungus camphoratus]|nr:hypothetical protein AcV7_009958 [Antrodia cinnamomea]